ncbi:hypothetical protein AB0J35_11990 [Nonomuraea angiospora]|uniref:hypothetical protein n=1 Tax=Nonomuraea angiospora TaxID=46172 RepID=UPI003443876A
MTRRSTTTCPWRCGVPPRYRRSEAWNTIAGLPVGISNAASSAVGAIAGVASSTVAAASVSLVGTVPGRLATAGEPAARRGCTQPVAGGAVTVNMYGTVIREEKDVYKLSREIGFQIADTP